jgi:hypothetical protein
LVSGKPVQAHLLNEPAQRPIDRIGVGKCVPNVGVEGTEALGALFTAHHDTLPLITIR